MVLHISIRYPEPKGIASHLFFSMASSTSSSSVSALVQGVSEKLSRENYLMWKAQVLTPVRGARLSSFF
jgi:hypothetical protein